MPFDAFGNAVVVSTTFVPFSDRVVVRPVEESDRTLGGLFKPDIAKNKPQMGDVVAVGPGRMTDTGDVIPMPVRVGDRVLFGKYSGTEIDLDGVAHLVIRATDVLGRMDTTYSGAGQAQEWAA